MSLDFLTRPIGKSAPKERGADSTAGARSRGATPSSGRRLGAVGGDPRVDLLPPEIRLKRAQLRTRRTLRLALFGVFVVVVAACGGSWAWSSLSAAALASAQAESAALIAQQGTFKNVTNVRDSIGLIQAGQRVGDSTEIDWQSYLAKVQATLPVGMSIKTVNIESATPLAPYAQANVPLQGARVATLVFSVTSPSADAIPPWLTGLSRLVGFVDATPGEVSLVDGSYTAVVTMHVNAEVFTKRYVNNSSITPESLLASATPSPSTTPGPSASATPSPSATTGGK